jgi:hypothetical protein
MSSVCSAVVMPLRGAMAAYAELKAESKFFFSG